jgi:2-octaprenyl-6-methoxyphenol hydroxylase
MKKIDTDILIVGAGLVGLLAAHCLSSLKYNIVVVDKKDLNSQNVSNKDTRTVAVSESSKKFLERFFLWSGIKNKAEPINTIKVFDRIPTNKILFQNYDKKGKLGYVIKNSIFINHLHNELKKKKNVNIFYDCELTKIDTNINYTKTTFKKKTIKSKLIIAADGKNSTVRNMVGTKFFKKHYSDSALVLNFYHENNLHNTAYEIFYNTGPLAILPMNSQNGYFQSSIIWSNKDLFIKKIINCEDRFIANIVTERVGEITGNIFKINSKQQFSLSAHLNEKFFNKRLVYIGDSAHSIHPIAGQGWNLGVKDVKNLHNVCNKFISKKQEIGSEFFCKNYNSLSYKNAFQLYQITDKLNLHFKRKESLYRFLSNKGFHFIENNKILKEKITNFAMGF